MKKPEIVNLILYIIAGLLDLGVLIIGVCNSFNINFYYAFILMVLVAQGLLFLIGIAIKEAISITYDSKRFNMVMFAFNLIMGVGLYYLVKYVGYYEEFNYLY